MKRTIKYLLTVTLLTAGVWVTSCDEAIEMPGPSGDQFETVAGTYGYVRNVLEPRSTTTLELYNSQPGTTEIYFGMTRPAAKTMSVSCAFDATALVEYNRSHATTYELYPESAVSLQSVGRTLVNAGSQTSSPIRVTVEPSAEVTDGKSYAVPLRLTPSDASVTMQAGEDIYMLLVRDMGSIPDASKASGIKIISCMEVNDTNPLNNLEFTLKNSGKMLVDIVVLFASNMNYDAATGRVYISNNENIQHLLDHRDTYLKPLQARGMKVVLAMMGNHDQAGVSGLADETARAFARDLKNLCEAYELDGIFWDDEYSEYAGGPGFVYPASSEAAARLIYETKKAMPDKLNLVYMAYAVNTWEQQIPGLLNTLPDVDGVQAGAYVDYAINDYRMADFPNHNGIRWEQVAIYPEEYAKNVFNLVLSGENEYEQMPEKGCGAHMIFAMDPTRANFQEPASGTSCTQLQSMQNIAEQLFGDQLVWSGKTYSKDW